MLCFQGCQFDFFNLLYNWFKKRIFLLLCLISHGIDSILILLKYNILQFLWCSCQNYYSGNVLISIRDFWRKHASQTVTKYINTCLLYTSDAADEEDSV